MTQPTLLVRCYIEHKNDQWQAFSLEFGLAAQGETEQDVRRKLESMIESYLEDALIGEDRAHADELLNRRATWLVYAKYYWTSFRSRNHGTYRSPVPLAPVHMHG